MGVELDFDEMLQASLDALNYTSPVELLGRSFHMSRALLKAPVSTIDKADQPAWKKSWRHASAATQVLAAY